MKCTIGIACLSSLVITMLVNSQAVMAQDEQAAATPRSPADAPMQAQAASSMQKTIWERSGVGLRLGGSWAKLVDDNTTVGGIKYAHRFGFAIGLFGTIGLHEWVAIQPELLYVSKGSKLELDGMLSNTIYASYIEMPILARIPIPIGEYRHLYALAGLAPSVLLGLEIEDRDDGSITDRTDVANKFDLGLLGGIGAQVAITPHHVLMLEGRYNRGLFSIYQMDNEENRAFSLMLGYQYSFASTPSSGLPGHPEPEEMPENPEAGDAAPAGQLP